MRRIDVSSDAAAARLDAFLARALSCSAGAARRLIESGLVTVDGRRAAKGLRLQPGQTVEVTADSPDVVPQPGTALELLYQDSWLLAVNKPAGTPSHPLRPGEQGTVANALVAQFPECARAATDPREGGLGHRLDRDTSGVLLAARSHEAWIALRAALAAPSCEKTYLAEVFGRPPAQGSVDLPIGQSGRHGARVRLEGGRGVLPAHTEWEVVQPRAESTLVRVRLHAGRRHQVRAHLASAGHPILGDDLYGTVESRELSARLEVSSVRLHAERIRLAHPRSGEALVIAAPPPAWGAIQA